MRNTPTSAWMNLDVACGYDWSSGHIAEHGLNIREGCLPVRQKKRGQAPERNKAIFEEVEKLVDADLNKACLKDGYPLPEIDWKVESLCGYPFKCFLDAYKGYHQIKMAKEDEEKTAFFTSQGIFCYTKMSFRLKNTGATYQCLVDKAFQKQIGQNLEVYVDDLVIKSRAEKEVEAVLNLPSPKCLKDAQKLNGKLASLNRFLSKSAEKALPFFKTLKKCTKKRDFQWTTKAEITFYQMKKLIAELPTLTAPKEKEELIMYLVAAKEAISVVLMTERDGKQMPIYFVSRALQGPEVNYIPMEKLILSLMMSNPKVAERLLKWIFELEEHDIHYRLRTSAKGQILVDFIVERPEDDPLDTPMKDKEELPDPW
ncbi:reverse transcriptase domain-containing protein, partial [Tanacetum coccineum]